MAVDDHGLADNRAVARETARPEAVTQHNDGMSTRRLVVVWSGMAAGVTPRTSKYVPETISPAARSVRTAVAGASDS